ncbi:U3 small nucleolar RNA-associated protein 6, partial [Trichostrongylus colubriformis]
LEKCIDNGHMSSDDFKDTCNRALEKVDPDENFPIWQHAIDYSIMHAPQETEQTFKDALKYANASVASRIKILFVEYLNELFNEGKLTAERLRERIMELVNNKPNRAEFYCALYRKEMERPKPDTKFAGFIIKTAVMEKDGVSVEAVILYGKWALAYDPAKFHFVHQTGLKLFEGPELEEFLTKWTRLLQDAATSEIEEEKDIQETTDVEVDKDVAPVKQEKQCQCECEKSKSARKGNKRKRKSEKRNSKKVKEILLNAD